MDVLTSKVFLELNKLELKLAHVPIKSEMVLPMNTGLIGSQWNRHCWLAGSILQKKLLRLEGKVIPSPETLREKDPELNIAESIELAREATAPRLVGRRVFVKFDGKWFDVTEKVEEAILTSREDASWIANIGVDTRALKVPELTKLISELAANIADGNEIPVTEPPEEVEGPDSSESS
ncbi:MAG: hypothetical protein ACFFB3_01355 [Candidatus Hodarchaeota archaeon]